MWLCILCCTNVNVKDVKKDVKSNEANNNYNEGITPVNNKLSSKYENIRSIYRNEHIKNETHLK